MQHRGVWTVVPITRECLPLVGSKTIFDIKGTESGEVDKFKVRLVVLITTPMIFILRS